MILAVPAGLSAQRAAPQDLSEGLADAWAEDGRLDLNRLPASAWFDFLQGDFEYAFQGGSGTASYEHIAGIGIRGEIVGSINGAEFIGSSLTFPAVDGGAWHRRWIDTLGNLLVGRVRLDPDYDGSELPALVSELEEREGVWFRHVWYDITPDGFGTDLLASQDGENWVLARRMPYMRVSAH